MDGFINFTVVAGFRSLSVDISSSEKFSWILQFICPLLMCLLLRFLISTLHTYWTGLSSLTSHGWAERAYILLCQKNEFFQRVIIVSDSFVFIVISFLGYFANETFFKCSVIFTIVHFLIWCTFYYSLFFNMVYFLL